MIHIADLRKNRLFDPTSTRFQGVLPPSGPRIIAESGRGQPLSGTRETSMARFVAAFAIPHPPSTIRHLSSAIRHLSSAIRHLSSAIRHLSSTIRHLSSAISPSPFPVAHSAFRIFAAPSRTVLRWRSSSIPNGLDGRADAETVDETLELLWDGERTLIVVSSDLSHQLPCAQKPSSLSQLAARRRQM